MLGLESLALNNDIQSLNNETTRPNMRPNTHNFDVNYNFNRLNNLSNSTYNDNYNLENLIENNQLNMDLNIFDDQIQRQEPERLCYAPAAPSNNLVIPSAPPPESVIIQQDYSENCKSVCKENNENNENNENRNSLYPCL